MADFDLGTARGRVELDTSSVDKATGSISTFNSKLSSSFSKTGAAMTSAGRKMTTAVTLPIIGIGVAAGKMAVDFEKTMNTMEAVAGVPGPELEKLRNLAIKLGADTVFSANEAGQAMLELAKAGVSTADIMGGALANTLDLATAGDLDLAEAATVAANAMNTFHLSGKESQVAVDALAGAANASSADVSDLAQALSQSGLAARNAGLDIAETTAVLAAFASNGIKGSDAGTSLKTMLLQLVPTTEKAKNMMKELGLDFVDAAGNIKPISEIFEEIHDKVGPLDQATQQLALKTIFGTDAFRAASIAMDLGAAGLAKYTKETNKQGTAAEVAKGKMKGLPGVIERLKGSFETFLLVVGDKLAPVIEKLAVQIGELLDKFAKLPDNVQENIIKFAALAAVVGPLLRIFGPLFSLLGGGIGMFGKLATSTGAAGTAAEGAAVGFGRLFSVFAGVGIAVQIGRSFQLAREELENFKEGDFDGMLQNIADAAKIVGINMPDFGETSDTSSFAEGMERINADLESGKLKAKDAAGAIRDLAAATNVKLGKIDISSQIIDSAGAVAQFNVATRGTDVAATAAGRKLAAMVDGYNQMVGPIKMTTLQQLNNLLVMGDTQAALSLLRGKWNAAIKPQKDYSAASEKASFETQRAALAAERSAAAKEKEGRAARGAAGDNDRYAGSAKRAGDESQTAKGKVDPYTNSLNNVPGNVTTDVHLNGVEAAISAAQNLGNILANLDNVVANPFVQVGHNARGTNDFIGGLTIVGERGPELAVFPKHTAIIPAHILRQIENTRALDVRGSGSVSVGTSAPSAIGGRPDRVIAMFELDGETLEQSVALHAKETKIKLGGRF